MGCGWLGGSEVGELGLGQQQAFLCARQELQTLMKESADKNNASCPLNLEFDKYLLNE